MTGPVSAHRDPSNGDATNKEQQATSIMRFTADGHPNDQLLSAYLAEAINDPAVAAAVSAHLATCTACQEQIAELQVITALLAELPAPALPRSFTLTGEELERLRPRPWYLRYQPLFHWSSAIAALLLVALLSVDLLAGGPAPAGMPASPPQPAADRQAAPEAVEATPVAALSAPAEPTPGETGSAQEIAPAGTPVPATESTPEAPVAVMAAPSTPQPTPAGSVPKAAGEDESSPAETGISPLRLATEIGRAHV